MPVEPAKYLPGEPMTVTVTVQVDEPTACKGLELSVRVRGEGPGFAPEIVAHRERLFAGDWSAGQHEYRRTLPAPDQATTFRGDRVKVSWWVEVSADIPWAGDPQAREEFVVRTPPLSQLELVLPPPETPETRRALEARRGEQAVKSKRAGMGCTGVGVLGLLAFVLGTALRYGHGATEQVWGPLMGLGGFVGGAFLVVVVGGALAARLGSREARPVDIAVALAHGGGDAGYRASATAGPSLTCVAYTDPDVAFESLTAHLEVNEFTEWVERGQEHRMKRSYEKTAMRRVAELAPTGTPGAWRGVLELGDQPLPPSIEDAGGHGVIWQVEIVPRRPGIAEEPERITRRIHARLRAPRPETAPG
jgi:hypothetical protein